MTRSWFFNSQRSLREQRIPLGKAEYHCEAISLAVGEYNLIIHPHGVFS